MNTNMALHLIIFSKDRAIQLDSLLRSIRDNYSELPTSLTVLFTTSSDFFKEGYQKLQAKKIIPEIKWHAESNFSMDLRIVVNSLENSSKIQFMTDDDVVFRHFDLAVVNEMNSSDLFCSLRVDRSYPRFQNPKFSRISPILRWNWYPLFTNRSLNFWYYPFSVDGNIFHTTDMQKMLSLIEFKAPNSFEGSMQRVKKKFCFLKKRTGIAPQQAVLYNNPLNSVQNEGETWNLSISPEWLNEQYLIGNEIINEVLYSSSPDEVHFAAKLHFSKDCRTDHI